MKRKGSQVKTTFYLKKGDSELNYWKNRPINAELDSKFGFIEWLLGYADWVIGCSVMLHELHSSRSIAEGWEGRVRKRLWCIARHCAEIHLEILKNTAVPLRRVGTFYSKPELPQCKSNLLPLQVIWSLSRPPTKLNREQRFKLTFNAGSFTIKTKECFQLKNAYIT